MAQILVADDESGVRGVLAVILKRAGHEVLIAANGQEVLNVVRARPVDLALLDIEMPVMSGLEACAAMKADPLLRKIPVLMMTGRAVAGVPDRARAAGALDMIPKPFDREMLLRRINASLPGGVAGAA